MEEQPPPLTPQEIEIMQAAQYADTGQPQTVKVFGIMHVIFGAYGILTILLAFVAMAGVNPYLALIPKTPAASAQMEQQAEMQTEMLPMTIAATVISVVITAFILTAGILMLKRRRNGLKWSNRYAWTSLAGKAFNAVIAIFYTYPMMEEMMSKSGGGAAMPGAMAGAMEWVMIGSMVFGILITCIYPILTLVLLNRPKTKEWFAAQPE